MQVFEQKMLTYSSFLLEIAPVFKTINSASKNQELYTIGEFFRNNATVWWIVLQLKAGMIPPNHPKNKTMSLHTFNCLACHILANSEKLKLSKWRNSNSDKSPKMGAGIIQPTSFVKKKSKLTSYSNDNSNQDVT